MEDYNLYAMQAARVNRPYDIITYIRSLEYARRRLEELLTPEELAYTNSRNFRTVINLLDELSE